MTLTALKVTLEFREFTLLLLEKGKNQKQNLSNICARAKYANAIHRDPTLNNVDPLLPRGGAQRSRRVG